MLYKLGLLFLDSDCDFLAVEDLKVGHDAVYDNFNVGTIFEHNSFAFALNDDCGVLALDQSPSIVWLHFFFSRELHDLFAVILKVPGIVFQLLFRLLLHLFLLSGCCRSHRLFRNFQRLICIGILFVSIFLYMFECSLR